MTFADRIRTTTGLRNRMTVGRPLQEESMTTPTPVDWTKVGRHISAPSAPGAHPIETLIYLGALMLSTMTVDRFPIPGRLGGRYTRDNIRPACAQCNSEDQGRQAVRIARSVAAS